MIIFYTLNYVCFSKNRCKDTAFFSNNNALNAFFVIFFAIKRKTQHFNSLIVSFFVRFQRRTHDLVSLRNNLLRFVKIEGVVRVLAHDRVHVRGR